MPGCFSRRGLSEVINEPDLTAETLLVQLGRVLAESPAIQARLETFEVLDSVAIITNLLRQAAAGR